MYDKTFHNIARILFSLFRQYLNKTVIIKSIVIMIFIGLEQAIY
jgi:hypothetical protein